MSAVFASLIPTFLLIATGWLCRTTGFVDDRQWAGLERTTYTIFFPALIIDTLSRANLRDVPVAGVGGALIAGILIVAIITLSLRKVLSRGGRVDGPSFTSIFQGATRWNTFVALSVAGSLFGQRGVALIAVAIAAMVPLLNLLAFYVFIRFAGQPRQSPYEILRSFASNPFIWSCAIGLILNFLVPPLPQPLALYVELMGRAALAAGLLVVGAGLDIRRLARPGLPHVISGVLKLLILPLIVVSLREWPVSRERSRGGDHRLFGALRERSLCARPPDGRQRTPDGRNPDASDPCGDGIDAPVDFSAGLKRLATCSYEFKVVHWRLYCYSATLQRYRHRGFMSKLPSTTKSLPQTDLNPVRASSSDPLETAKFVADFTLGALLPCPGFAARSAGLSARHGAARGHPGRSGATPGNLTLRFSRSATPRCRRGVRAFRRFPAPAMPSARGRSDSPDCRARSSMATGDGPSSDAGRPRSQPAVALVAEQGLGHDDPGRRRGRYPGSSSSSQSSSVPRRCGGSLGASVEASGRRRSGAPARSSHARSPAQRVAPSRMRSFVPSARGSSGEPGTAKTSRPCSRAKRAVMSEPERRAASTTTTP